MKVSHTTTVIELDDEERRGFGAENLNEEMIPHRYKKHSAKIIEIMKRHGKDRRAIVEELKNNGIIAKSTYWADVSFVKHIIDEIAPAERR